jgi:RimJ/RimL family protein N-acetyltransferase
MASRVLAREGRVSVRRFRRGDLRDRLAWPPYTDPFFTHLNYPLATFIEREKWLFARTVNTGRIYFAIADENDHLIGEMSLRDIDTAGRASRLGIHLASDKVDKGYGGEALAALLKFYFGEMGYLTMYLDVAAFNVRALRLYERLHYEHLSPFWRRIYDFTLKDVPIYSDARYGTIRRFFRGDESHLECLYYDMALTKEHYLETLPRAASPAQASRPQAYGS